MNDGFAVTCEAQEWRHECNSRCHGSRHAEVAYVDDLCETDGQKLESLRELEQPLGIQIVDISIVREPPISGELYSPRPDKMPTTYNPVLIHFSFNEPESVREYDS